MSAHNLSVGDRPEIAVGGNISAHESASDDSGEVLTLPFDVMAQIMARSTPSIISALMKTCHLYYREGPRHLLRDGVILRSPTQVERFLPFVYADGGVRFVHFRELDIAVSEYGGYPSVDVERCMAQLAQLLDFPETYLESLTLRDAEWLLQHGCLASTLPRTNIERLTMRDSGPRACSALKSLNCSLTSLTISCKGYAVWEDAEELQTMDGWSYLLSPLSPHAQTLETFRCDSLPPPAPSRSFQLVVFSSSPRPMIRPTVCFSAVRNLCLSIRLVHPEFHGHIEVASLLPTFPNVTHLEIVSRIFQRPAHSLSGLGQSLLERNKETFKQYGCWATLKKCSGELASLYTLGLVCHVVDLCIWSQVEDDDDLSMLAAVVSATRPKVLRLSVDGPFTLITKALRDAAFESLETLHIILNIRELYGGDRDGTSADFTEFIFAVLTPFPPQLVTLELFIEFRGSHHHTLNSDLQALDKLRRRLIAHSKPTLQSVLVLHANGYQLQPPTGRAPQRDDSSVSFDGNFDSEDDEP
ncbi:hypothetical protein L226DRAFT_561911 [Lentinus tigrinus ALCF2SS1-7]|uniref:F-box domain-containing protein n=1 Tax=Lentinus tigrinus ALCF2SS1-6 TaxID=1328759 RepID=A0A5C2S9U3_9APHY|nr:hypothetical protein L227DRAFT_613172 [Lentinus tigrinus ALCF2SS1-6]RPD72207.1 hypothetical protein L226DRAFT_561911 [Lentinus tigrinus ALCF2SS1-7]